MDGKEGIHRNLGSSEEGERKETPNGCLEQHHARGEKYQPFNHLGRLLRYV